MRLSTATLLLFAFAIATSATAQTAGPAFSKAFAPEEVGPGSVATLTFTIDNATSQSPAADLAFEDVLPAGMTIASPAVASTTCSGGGGRDAATPVITADEGTGTVGFSGGAVPAGATCTVQVNVTSAALGTSSNTSGDLTSSLGNSGPASASLDVLAARPGFTKSFSPATVALGGRSTLTFLIDNAANPAPVSNLDFTDDFPAGLVVASPSNRQTTCGTATVPATVTASAGGTRVVLDADGTGAFPAVAAGATCSVSVDVVTTAAGALGNVSQSLLADSEPAGKASAVLTSLTGTLALTKSFLLDPVAPGETVPLRFTLRNISRDGTATAIAFNDSLGAALTGLAATGGFPASVCNDGTLDSNDGGATLEFSGGTLATGEACAFEVEVTVPEGTGTGEYLNETTIPSGDVNGSVVVGRRATATLFVEPVPLLVKTFTDDPVSPGANVTLQFSVTNTADSPATAIAFDDELTDILGLPLVTDLPAPSFPSNPQGGRVDVCGTGSRLSVRAFDLGGQGVQLTGGALGAGETCTFEVVLTVPDDIPGRDYLNTTSEVIATIGGQTFRGNPASDVLTIVGGPDLTKDFLPGTTAPGGTVALAFSLTFAADAGAGSPLQATAIAFTDTLATDLETTPNLNQPACGGTLTSDGAGAALAFSGGVLAAGEDCSFSVPVTVASTAGGAYLNTTSGLASTVDGVAVTGSSASATLTVSALSLAKAFVDDPAQPGGTVTLEFTLANGGDEAITGVGFSDDLDEALGGLAAAAGETPASVCGGSLSGSDVLTFSGGELAPGETCTISVVLDVPAGAADGQYLNTTSAVAGATSGGAVSGPPASDLLTVAQVLPATPPTLAAAFAPETIAAGSSSQLTLTIDNLSSGASATGLAVTATLPAAVTIADPASIASTCGGTATAVSGTNTLELAGGAVGSGASCAVAVAVTTADEGVFMLSTTDLASDLGSSPAASAKLTAIAPEVVAGKSASFDDADEDGFLSVGEVLTYQIEIAADETLPTDVTLTDSLDAHTTLVDGSPAFATAAGSIAAPPVITVDEGVLTAELSGLRGAGVLTFDVVLADPYPVGASEVCNQGVLSGGFADILTNDPTTPDAFDATCTPIRLNNPPVAVAAADQTTAECSAGSAVFALDGSGSSDPEHANAVLTFVWTGPFAENGGTAVGETTTVTLPLGESTVTLTVTDPLGASDTAELVLTVEDTQSPVVTLTAASLVLWPPNHSYETIALADLGLSASDACDTDVSAADVLVAEASSDEPENGQGDGNTTDDIVIAPTCDAVDVRAERKGNGNGRVYAIELVVADGSGNTGGATYEVAVPKSPNRTAVRDAAAYTVSGCAAPAAVLAAGSEAAENPVATPEAPESRAVPEAFALGASYPNPTSRLARVRYDVPTAASVRLAVYDALGRQVAVLADGPAEPGSHEAVFYAHRLPAGTYLLRFTTDGGFAQTRPMTVLR